MNPLRILTLRRAIVLAVVIGLIVPAVLVAGVFWLQRFDTDIKVGTRTLLNQNAELLAHAMQEPLWNVDQESATALLDVMLRNEDMIHIEVRDNVIGVVASGERAQRRIGFTASTTQPVYSHGKVIGSVLMEVGSARLQRVIYADLQRTITGLAAQILLSVLLVLVLLERRLVRPMEQLGTGAERLARGQLDVPFEWDRPDEIGLLSQRLERTRISLRSLFDELGGKNRELERDIEMRKQVESELQERETRFRLLVEQSPIAIIEWDLHFRVLEWNAAAEQIFGYSRREAVGQYAGFIIADRNPDQVDQDFRALIDKGGTERNIRDNLRADGSRIVCQWRNTYIAGQGGQVGRLLSMAEDITEKRDIEEARRLSEAKFAGAFEGNPDSVSIVRLNDGLILDVNQAFETLTGFSRAHAVGKTTIGIGMWDKPEQRMGFVAKLIGSGRARDFAMAMRTSDGRLRSCVMNSSLLSVGADVCIMSVIRDITDQRLQEAQKAEVDRALLRLAQGTREIAGESFFHLLIADLAAALHVDHAFIALRVTGQPDMTETIANFGHGERIPNCQFRISGSPCEVVLAGDLVVFPSNLQNRFPDDPLLIDLNCHSYAGAPIRNAQGEAIGVLAVLNAATMHNIDLIRTLLQIFSERASAELERQQAQVALRNSEQRFAAMFHASPVSMALSRFGGNHALLDVNQAFERLHRRSRASVVGSNSIALGMYVDIDDRNSIIKTLTETDRLDRFQTWMRMGDGSTALIQVSGTLFNLGEERLLILTGEDVTELHEIEEQILELNSTLEERVTERTNALRQANSELASTLETLNMAQGELVRSEKLAALGALVAGIAHELNTPIGNSLMVASTLADRTREFAVDVETGLKRSALESYLQDADKASEILVRNLYRAADLVTSFKQVAMDQTSSQRRRFSLAEVIAEIMLTLSPTIRKTAFQVRQNIPAGLVMDSYPGPLGQVLTNLVNNALLHGFEGRRSGVVKITASAADEGWIALAVSDDGIGIPAHNLNRIYDPFFTTKLGAGGSGLGLNIVHNIVTSILGGRVRVDSEVGAGATFTLMLPLTAPAIQADDATLALGAASV